MTNRFSELKNQPHCKVLCVGAKFVLQIFRFVRHPISIGMLSSAQTEIVSKEARLFHDQCSVLQLHMSLIWLLLESHLVENWLQNEPHEGLNNWNSKH